MENPMITKQLIERLPLPAEPLIEESLAPSVDLTSLPDGIVNGGSLIGFEPEVGAELRSSVALSLLAAQQVANADSVAVDPDLWVQRHNMVLRGLNFVSAEGATVSEAVTAQNLSVHDAILPLLTAAFGSSIGAGSLIVKALEQMKTVAPDTPWITLYNRHTRRFDVREFRFAAVDVSANTVLLRLAAARFRAVDEVVQVLFFKFRDTAVDFRLARSTMAANANLLEAMNDDLQAKLHSRTQGFIAGLDL